MNINWLLIPTLVFAVLLFFLGRYAWQAFPKPAGRCVLLAASFLFAAPAVLFVIYYFHWFDNAVWFYQFRSLHYSELLAAGAGILAGILSASVHKRLRLSAAFLLILLLLGIFIPHVKSVIYPVNCSELENDVRNGFCLQSSNSTCGPASAVTLLNHFGIEATEAELAKECYTYIGGTEVWYIARALRKRNLDCHFEIYTDKPFDLPRPAIAGINIGAGHFITIIEEQGDAYITGDPIAGRKIIEKEDIFRRINFTGFFLIVDRKP